VWRETLSKLDFVVSIDRQFTADAAYADIVLPATTMFEIDSYMVYGPLFRLREKLVEPVGEARNDYEIMCELARRLGYGDQYPEAGEPLLRFVLQGSGYTLEDVKNAGGWVQAGQPLMEYRKWEKGRLRADGRPGFETPTWKFEIRSTLLEEYGYEGLPKYTEPVEGPLARPDLARSFPLVFNSGARPHTDFRSQSHDIPELAKDHPEPTVEINSSDAAARGIQSGDLVEVRTLRGAVPFRAVVTGAIVQGSVECNMGGGTPVGSRPWQEWNVNELTDLGNFDEISGFPVYKALLCDVVLKAKGTSAATGEEPAPCLKYLFEPPARRAPSRRVYLDNNATTFVTTPVREAMLPYLEASCGNPSSLHGNGREARDAVEAARRSVATLLNAKPRRLVFTGCGSEANNLALKGVAFSAPQRQGHIVTSSIEHPSILATCRFLERLGHRVTYLDVDTDGMVMPCALEAAMTRDTVLVSIMLANNEVGTIQPISELAAVAHAGGALFHTDAVQAAGKIVVDVEALGVDLMTVAAHKFHGPKGVGALFVRAGVSLEPVIHGGSQEHRLRAGTENVAGVVGMGRAAELAVNTVADADGVRTLRDQLEAEIRRLVPGARLNGHATARLPNTLNLTLPKLRGESLVVAMDQHGIELSSGSACKTGSPEPTHVLLAMGRAPDDAHCAVRFSLSSLTSVEDIDLAVAAIGHVLQEMETTVRFLPCK
jgi:cysteine desulfurase NifS